MREGRQCNGLYETISPRVSAFSALQHLGRQLPVVEADKQLLSAPYRWGTKIASWTQQGARKFVVRRGIFFHVEESDFFSFGGPDLVDRVSQFEGLRAAQPFLA